MAILKELGAPESLQLIVEGMCLSYGWMDRYIHVYTRKEDSQSHWHAPYIRENTRPPPPKKTHHAGESLLNDGSALVLFTLARGMVVSQHVPTPLEAVQAVARLALIGPVIGLAVGALASYVCVYVCMDVCMCERVDVCVDVCVLLRHTDDHPLPTPLAHTCKLVTRPPCC